jgi:hypothetical protein
LFTVIITGRVFLFVIFAFPHNIFCNETIDHLQHENHAIAAAAAAPKVAETTGSAAGAAAECQSQGPQCGGTGAAGLAHVVLLGRVVVVVVVTFGSTH